MLQNARRQALDLITKARAESEVELARATGLAPEAVAVALSELELSGLVFSSHGVFRVTA